MLGWQFFVMHREGETAFASWFSGLGGAQWIRNLAAEGKATVTAEGGYPTRFQTPAKNLMGFLKAGRPPAGHRKFVIGDDYIDSGSESWGIKIDEKEIDALNPEDILTIEAWDQS